MRQKPADKEYLKHSKLAKKLTQNELQKKIEELREEMFIIDAKIKAYRQETYEVKDRKVPDAMPYWQD